MDIINIIKLGQISNKLCVQVRNTKKNRRILSLLVSKRLIRGYFRQEFDLRILLKYDGWIRSTLISKPSKRVYYPLKKVVQNHVISSSSGISYGYHFSGGEPFFYL